MTTQTITIRYKVDSNGALVATGAVVKQIQQIGPAANSANNALAAQRRQIQGIQGALREYTSNLRSLFGLYLTFQGVQSFSRFIDEYTNLNGRLQVVLGSTERYAQAQRDVYQISQQTYTSLASTANLYARLTVSLEEMNSSQTEIANITRTVNQALLISGATSSEAASAVLQLSQAFASGVLRGEEFNAVNEAGPRIMTSLAKSLGVSRGALREMASEGKLTAEVLRKALVEDAANIAKEAENIPLTIGRGWQSFVNDLQTFIGKADKAYGVSKTLAEGLRSLGQNLDRLAAFAGDATIAFGVAAGARGIGALIAAAKTAGGTIALLLNSGRAFLTLIGGWPGAIALASVGLLILANRFILTAQSVRDASEAMDRFREVSRVDPNAGMQVLLQSYDRISERIAQIKEQLETLGSSPRESSAVFAQQLTEELQALQQQATALDGKFAEFVKGTQAVRTSSAAASDSVKIFANNQRTLNDSIVSSGTPLGLQIKAAQELSAKLQDLSQQEKKGILSSAQVERQRRDILASYQKEINSIGKVNQARARTQASINGEASTRERLNNIIAMFSRENDDAGKSLTRYESLLREVTTAGRNYAGVAREVSEATVAIQAAINNVRFEDFNNEISELFRTLSQGRIDQHAQAMLRLALAIEELEGVNGPVDHERIRGLRRAMEELEIQAGKSASASDLLRETNRRLADQAQEQAEDYQNYWEGAFNEVANTVGEFFASGMKDWKEFGKSLLNIVKKIVADIVAEFLRMNVINPIMNQMFGAMSNGLMRQTGGSGLLSIFGGGGGSGGGFGNILGSLFGGGGLFGGGAGVASSSLMTGLSAMPGMAGFAGVSAGGGAGGGIMGAFSSIPIAGWIAAAMAMNQGFFSEGWRAGGGTLTLPNGQQVRGGSGSNALGNLLTAGGVSGLDRALRGLGLSDSVASLISGSSVHARLFGRRAPVLTNAEETLRFGATSSASVRYRTLEEGGVFRSDRRRWHTGTSDEATRAAEAVFESLTQTVSNAARSMQGEAPQLLDAALRTVQEFDSKGKVKATKYFVDILGRSWEEASMEAAVDRLTAENIIATIDSILGETVSAASTTVADATSDVVNAAATGAANAAADLGNTIGDIIKDTAVTGEASAIAERWRDDSAMLLEGAQFLLAAATDIRNGIGLLGDEGGLTAITDLVEDLQYSGETLLETYARLHASVTLLDSALSYVGAEFDGTREEAVRFANSLVEAAGGLESFASLFQAAMDGLFSEQEQAEIIAEQAGNALTEALSNVGLTLGEGGIEAVRESLREMLRTALASGDTEQVLSLLRAGAALNAYVEAQDALTALLEQGATAAGEAEEGLSNLFDTLVEGSGQANEAMSAYRAFMDGIQSERPTGLTEFNQQMQDINSWVSSTLIEARNLAQAAGLQGIAEQDLAAIHEEAAYRAAQAIAALMDSTQTIVDQLDYAEEQAGSLAGLIYGRFQLPEDVREVNPERFDLASQLAVNVRQLSEALGQSFSEILENFNVPLDRFIEDLGVNLRQVNDSENFDRFVNAARSLGAEVTDLATRVGFDAGALSDRESALNNAFERAMTRLPASVSTSLRPLLTNLENASSPEARQAAERQLEQFINSQPPAIRAALAPFLEGVDVQSYEEQQLTALDQTNRYLSAANEFLGRIAANTSKPPTGPTPVSGRPGEKTAAEAESLSLLRQLLSTMQGMERELRGRNQKAVVGINGG